MVFTLLDEANDRWVAEGQLGNSDSGAMLFCTGSNQSMSNTLTQIFLGTPNGTDNFDNGSIGLIVR